MLDIRLIREDPAAVQQRLRARGGDHWQKIDQVLACDSSRRAAETERQQLQAERNRLSKEIGIGRKNGQDTSDLEQQVRDLAGRLETIGHDADRADAEQRDLLLQIPNLPHAECPPGLTEADNPEVRSWGEQPSFDFTPLDHVELGKTLGILDFEAAARLSGSGFAVFRGAGARLERALIQFMLDLHSGEHGYTEVSTPFMIHRDCMEGTGQLPKFEDDMYAVTDSDLFLAPTAEVPVTNLEREQLLAAAALPIRYTAYTPCFRREAGAAGKESRGLIRMHQFDKVELVQICRPEDSEAALETLTHHAETVLQRLGLHYRLIELCAGDIGFSACKTYDIEIWAPGHGGYLEVSSCSNFGDYQARRMNLRFKDDARKNHFCHTLNGSGTALPRLVVALLETGQQADGSVRLPEALVPWFGSDVILPPAD